MRIAGIWAHPDDESFAAAGLLSLAALRGARVDVVCATRGEAGRAREPVAGPLAAVRVRELAAACRAIGAAPPTVWGLPDGAVTAGDVALAARRWLAGARPDVVVTFGPDGGYGHRDHIAVSRGVAEAVGPGVRVLHAVFPTGLLTPVWAALRRLRPSPVVDPLPPTPRAPQLVVDVAPVRARKLAALAAHTSQLAGGDPRTFLWPGVVDRLLATEAFAVAAGPPLPPGAADPFAGLDV